MAVTIRPVGVEETRAFHQAMGIPFGFDPSPEQSERFSRTVEVSRLRAACDGDQIVGTFGAYSLDLNVPGGRLPASGVTVITVLPTHRRQGVLREMMAEHFRELHRAGREPLAALWASESAIYGRFGFAPAVEGLFDVKIGRSVARLRDSVNLAGTMRLVDMDEAADLFPPIFDTVRRSRPGMFARTENWWRARILEDSEENRHGQSALRCVVHERNGEPVGYVMYRTKVAMSDPEKTVHVRELIAVDPVAERALWQFVFGIDLSTHIEGFNLPVDCPLTWWLEDSRALNRKVEDSMWLRLIDVPTALAGRQYATSGDVVIAVRDETCPWNDGTYRLVTDESGRATCDRVDETAEIETSAGALASAYMAGYRLADLARAGLVRGEPQAIRDVDRLFDWHHRPWCQEVF